MNCFDGVEFDLKPLPPPLKDTAIFKVIIKNKCILTHYCTSKWPLLNATPEKAHKSFQKNAVRAHFSALPIAKIIQ
jgi:hypothetical protein